MKDRQNANAQKQRFWGLFLLVLAHVCERVPPLRWNAASEMPPDTGVRGS